METIFFATVILGVTLGGAFLFASPFFLVDYLHTKECETNINYAAMEKHTTTIVSLEKQTLVNGHFTLGFGNIGEDMYYYAYTMIGKDNYKLFKIDSDNVVIKETNKEPPKYINDTCKYTKTLIVPKGTITKQFNL